MKKRFSNKWKGSKQPRKQRKYLANAPRATQRKFLSSHLSKELRKKYGKRSMSLRKNDVVKVMVGEYKNKEGKISGINMKNLKVAIEGLQITKRDGSKVNVWICPSKLLVKELVMEDKKRLAAMQKKNNKINKTEGEK